VPYPRSGWVRLGTACKIRALPRLSNSCACGANDVQLAPRLLLVGPFESGEIYYKT